MPARMRRLLVGGHKAHLEGVIDTLHAQGVLHIEDYVDPTHTTDIGTPLEAGEKASELLVQVRGLQKALGCDPAAAPAAPDADPAKTLHAAEAATKATLDAAGKLAATLQALESEAATLRPLEGLDFELSAVPGLRSVKVFAGTCRTDPSAAVQATGVPHELQVAPGPGGLAVLLIVGAAHAAAAEKALAESGFASVPLPAASGTPAERLAAIAAERAQALARQEAATQERALLAKEWAPRLAAAEHALAAAVEKTQAPLKFAVTESTFHIEGWVPQSQLAAVRAALEAGFGASLYVEDLGDAPREHAEPGHHHRHGEHGADHAQHASGAPVPATTTGAGGAAHDEAAAHGEEAHHASDAKDEPPIHLENKGLARPYEFLLGLLGLPRYGEVDPTKLMLLFFPLFFGLMVGDVGVGILIMLVGYYLKTHKVFGIGGPAVGRSILMGGFMSALVGLFVFGEAFGIHFVISHEAATVEHELSWENILGLHLPFATDAVHGLLYKTGAPDGVPAHPGLLTPHTTTHLAVAGIVLGWYSKTHDTLALLVWAMLIGLVHVVLGLAIGIRNVYKAHGLTLAIQEKAAWLTFMAGTAMAVLAWGGVAGYLGLAVAVASVALLYMGAAHVIGVGFIAFLELPGLAGNILSYTRLAAIGASKAGMAVAFGNIAFVVIAGHNGVANTGSLVGWLVYLVAFGLILVLSIIAGTLQSLRLQFVEFFGKFFTGGGRPYVPFGRRAA